LVSVWTYRTRKTSRRVLRSKNNSGENGRYYCLIAVLKKYVKTFDALKKPCNLGVKTGVFLAKFK
jgi:hypothetical protein